MESKTVGQSKCRLKLRRDPYYQSNRIIYSVFDYLDGLVKTSEARRAMPEE